MGQFVLTDHGGNEIAGRLGVVSVKKVLKSPVKPTLVCKHLEYAMVWCESADTFIMRLGHGKVFTLTIVYWKYIESEQPSEEHFEADELDKAIKRFVTLTKRKPKNAPA